METVNYNTIEKSFGICSFCNKPAMAAIFNERGTNETIVFCDEHFYNEYTPQRYAEESPVSSTKDNNILEEAQKAVYTDRPEQNGRFYEVSQEIGAIWARRIAFWKEEYIPNIPPWLVDIMLIDLKIVRALCNPKHKDHWVDIAGYAAGGWESIKEDTK